MSSGAYGLPDKTKVKIQQTEDAEKSEAPERKPAPKSKEDKD
ncbi:MAG TPA: hypothetical protein VE783_00670 [Candidatus Limnocylindrales bacterium]|nr:hypothetical protein [Candidatus Limnocylindrales bacterium]